MRNSDRGGGVGDTLLENDLPPTRMRFVGQRIGIDKERFDRISKISLIVSALNEIVGFIVLYKARKFFYFILFILLLFISDGLHGTRRLMGTCTTVRINFKYNLTVLLLLLLFVYSLL